MKTFVIRDEEQIRKLTNEQRDCVIITITDNNRAKISNKDFTKKDPIDYNLASSILKLN